MAKDLPSFQAYQQIFCAHVRDSKRNKPPANVVKARMAVYSEIVFNNLFSSVSACFPVSSAVLGKRAWVKLVRGFFAHYPSQSPIFRDIPKTFLNYLNSQQNLPIYLFSLAHYEWVELAVSTMETVPFGVVNSTENKDLMVDCIVVNPTLALLKYHYAVHQISQKNKPKTPLDQPVYLAVYRNEAFKVQFVELNEMTAQLLHVLKDKQQSGVEALTQLAESLNYPEPQALMTFGASILQQLHTQEIIF